MNDQNLLEDQPIAWTPTPDVIERAQLTKFMRQLGVSTWDELYAFSIKDVERFTEEVIKFLDIKFDPPYEKLLDTSNGIEFPTWFRADSPQRRRDAKAQKVFYEDLSLVLSASRRLCGNISPCPKTKNPFHRSLWSSSPCFYGAPAGCLSSSRRTSMLTK